MIQLSAVVITFNEEKNIERCILSLQGVADEIVVVDSYSNDRTEAICAQYGVRFVQHPFAGHIQQKNWAITQASSPYVLSLDADEALSEELRQSILAVKKTGPHKATLSTASTTTAANGFTTVAGIPIANCASGTPGLGNGRGPIPTTAMKCKLVQQPNTSRAICCITRPIASKSILTCCTNTPTLEPRS